MNRSPFNKLKIAIAIVLISASYYMMAQNLDSENSEIETITIVGSKEDARNVAGSVSVLTSEDLEIFEYTDIHKILASVPGVNFRPEEGYGLRPNISLRGTYSDRSSKITLMEDGILIAPGPYSASSAYYFPTTGRLSGVEAVSNKHIRDTETR